MQNKSKTMQDTENWKEELVKEIMIFTEKNNRNLWYDFISRQIAEAEKRERERIRNLINEYKSYYNPSGDAVNSGKHKAMDDLLSELLNSKE